MEPVEIVGVVAAALQFLEFGFKLVTKTIQIKDSSNGLTNENTNLLDIANDLDKYAELMHTKWRDYSGKHLLGDKEKFLAEAIKDCQQISNEMQTEIRKRSRKGRNTWGALYQAFRSIAKDNYVSLLAKRLEAAKEKITKANLACIFDDVARNKLSLIEIQHQLQHLTQSLETASSRFEKSLGVDEIGNNDPTEARNSSSGIVQTSWGTLDSNSPIMNAMFKELVDKIWNPHWDYKSAKNKDEYLPAFLDKFTKYIIQSLQFDDIQKREQEIRETFEATFEWIWETDPPKDHQNLAWSSFPDWLESEEENLYWITGVPGAGKSTLMKYIQHDSKDRLVRHLTKWEPDSSLLLLHYYAWNAGMDELKSCEGLLRTILFQGLEAEPDLVPIVAKRRLALFGTLSPKALRDFELLPQKPWELANLQECLQSFVEELGGRKKLVIFVDGLDEFETPPQQVVAQIQELRNKTRTKVCVASRPWIEFEKALIPCPHLRMDKLTSNDISAYIKGKLEVRAEFLERQFEVSDLTKQIRNKAQGVFLWVTLVVEHMLPSLEGGKSLAALQQAIDELPAEVQKLYDVIWKRIPKEFKEDASKLFRLFCASQLRTDMLRMWLAYEGKTPSYKFEIREGWDTTIRSITIRRLNSHARGILKLSGSDDITVPHKTAYEWILQAEVQDEMSSCIHLPFNPALRWMNASLIVFKCFADNEGAIFHDTHVYTGADEALVDAFFYACGTCSPDATPRKDSESDITLADDIVHCFNELAILAESWQVNNLSWRRVMRHIRCPNFVCLMARLGIVDYVRNLQQSDPGMFLECIDSVESKLEGNMGLSHLVSPVYLPLINPAMPEFYSWAKLECVKLLLSEMPESHSDAYLTILWYCLVARKHRSRSDPFTKESDYYDEVWKHMQQGAKERGFEKRLERDLDPSKGRRLWMWFGMPLSNRRRHLILECEPDYNFESKGRF